jgi:hypothetical protein
VSGLFESNIQTFKEICTNEQKNVRLEYSIHFGAFDILFFKNGFFTIFLILYHYCLQNPLNVSHY